MKTTILYVFFNSLSKYCFTQDIDNKRLPAPIEQWELIQTDLYTLVEGEETLFSVLADEIAKSIAKTDYFIIDFADFVTLLRIEYQESAKKWDTYIRLKEKSDQEGDGFKDMILQNQLLKAKRECDLISNRYMNLLAFHTKNQMNKN